VATIHVTVSSVLQDRFTDAGEGYRGPRMSISVGTRQAVRSRREAADPTGARPMRAADMIPIEHQMVDRVLRTLSFAVPAAALLVAGWLAWGGVLHWADVVVLAITYTVTGLGITVGYHRHFTHRSFETTRVVRVPFAVFGTMAVEGPLLEWVATHRKHHRFADQSGDPGGRSSPPMSLAISRGWRRSRSARPGTTTTMRFPPRRVTDWAGGRSTPAPG
jgi:fatty acid desaturase